ncbi:MAG: chitobiase/beta-hexosaminidase C-terminal domain-containing protein, partial [Bacteroidaceae bacterium]|nr:chitobiase/beta-hexosaminidase C-terminal domain-containing protein [Bacteroidaceae bacterium]
MMIRGNILLLIMTNLKLYCGTLRKSVLMLIALIVLGGSDAWGQIPELVGKTIVLHNKSIETANDKKVSLAYTTEASDPCRVMTTDDDDKYQQWIVEDAGKGKVSLKNVGSGLYLQRTGTDNWTMGFTGSVPDNTWQAKFTLERGTNGDEFLIKTDKGSIGTNSGDRDTNKPVYADKKTDNGNVLWKCMAAPTITQDDGYFTITKSDDSSTIYYTTDGTKPTTSSATYTAPFSKDGIILVRAIEKKEGLEMVPSLEANLINTTPAYLFKNNEAVNTSYYLIPPFDESTYRPTTSNVPNENMAWRVEDAGIDNNIQYYYLKNAANNHYMYCDKNGDYMDVSMLDELNKDGYTADYYQFRIAIRDNGTYVIIPKFFPTQDPTTGDYCFYNKSNHMSEDKITGHNNISLKADNTDNASSGYTRWNLIICPNDPKTLFDNSFASTNSC